MVSLVTAHSQPSKFALACEQGIIRLKELTLKILHILKEILQFPKRYMGSKETFGYSFNDRTDMSSKELHEKIDLACSCAFVHNCNPEWIEPFGYHIETPASFSEIDQTIESRERCFFDPKTGLKATVVRKEDVYLITFGAKGSDKSEIPYNADERHKITALPIINTCLNIFGGVPAIYEQADQLVSDLLKDPRFSGKKVIFTGQCYGASLASYAALMHQKEAFCVNAVPLGAGLQQKIGAERLKIARQTITHLTVKKDWLTDLQITHLFDRFLSALGVRTPGNFGKQFMIPSAFNSRIKSHSHAVESMMKHLGYPEKTRPAAIYHS
ncbi:putative uncharacterized protein [Waddlia chondrophila 2032/99]|uniref:Fungal lipase-like domain-containing protein n=2 Tax=Waddlia chondrophila TaxID=71667 RepID=D6YUJ7_WADCW|nr:hypothetical protein [Waddlia chondrophila]ADI37808.1 hypothetical protein wcw_0436 [Waddlia chondrophila WSU 86-1044]CCB91966.1 putative uncharacterized protein [Waddlia chondrophila 2032/99]